MKEEKNSTANESVRENQTARLYNRTKLVLSLGNLLLLFLSLSFLVISGLSKDLDRQLNLYLENDYLRLMAFSAILWICFSVIRFPLHLSSDFLLEHKYGLSGQTFRAWVWQNLKAGTISAIIGIPILLIFFFLIKKSPDLWWVYLGIVLFFFSMIIGRIAPVLIFPLFYKFHSIEDHDLAERISDLANKSGLSISGVYAFNLSKDTKKANAAFTGLGKSRRVIIGDTLLNKFSEQEILAVLSHELGHFKYKHIHKMIAIGTISIFTGLYLAYKIYMYFLPFFGFTTPDEIGAFPLLMLIITCYGLFFGPIQNMISRKFEREADNYVVKTVPELRDAFISALHKLTETNLAEIQPNPVVEFLFHSHPSIKKRIKRLQA